MILGVKRKVGLLSSYPTVAVTGRTDSGSGGGGWSTGLLSGCLEAVRRRRAEKASAASCFICRSSYLI